MKIENHVFFITGGASGLGYAAAEHIIKNNGKVVLADLNVDLGNEAAKTLGANAIFVECNVVKEKSVQDALNTAVETFGELHGVLNCAGVGAPKKVLSSRGVHDMKTFEFVVGINLMGTFNVLRLAADIMSKQGAQNDSGERGVIINTASVAAFEGQIGQAAYSASKGAVVSMTLPIARELSRHGIRVFTIAPGIFDTPMMKALPEKARISLGKQVPFPQRMGDPHEFAHMCATIIENSYLNGNVVRIDGSIRMGAM